MNFFCPCMSEHMIYSTNVTNVTKTLHQNVTYVTKQNIAPKEFLMREFHTKYMDLISIIFRICIIFSSVARAFSGERVAPPEDQIEEKMGRHHRRTRKYKEMFLFCAPENMSLAWLHPDDLTHILQRGSFLVVGLFFLMESHTKWSILIMSDLTTLPRS